MSIASEISRLQTAKAAIVSAIEGHGVTVPSGTTFSGFAILIASIESGGGAPSLEDIASGKLDYTTQATIDKGAYDASLDILRGVSGGMPVATLGDVPVGALVAFNDPEYTAGKMPYYVLGQTHKQGCVTLHRSKTFSVSRASGITGTGSAYPTSTQGVYLNNTFYDNFDPQIKGLVQQVPVISRNAVNNFGNTATDMHIFALSYYELFGHINYGGTGAITQEGDAIPWLAASANNRMRKQQDTDANQLYFTRTAFYSAPTYNAIRVDASGSGNYAAGNTPYCPALCMLATQPVAYNAAAGYYEIVFGTEIDFVAHLGDASTRPTQIAVNFDLLGDSPQLLSCQVCNNVNDASPTWEAYTRNAIHAFANQTKTADQWGYGCRIAAQSVNGVVECTAPYFMGVPV